MSGKKAPRGPQDYWHIGPVYIWKWLFLLLVGAGSILVLTVFGFSLAIFRPANVPPIYRYNDPALQTITGVVRITDSAGRVRYQGEIAQGAYTGTGQVYDEQGQLCYEGPLVDGVYEGQDAKVYTGGQLVYTGDMSGNYYEGQGRRIDLQTGVVSQGQFSRGMLSGQGQEYDAQGHLLREGVFARDLLNGAGKEYNSAGFLLREGTFSDGLLHGTGTEYTEEGVLRYQGQFQRGVYQGMGTLYDTKTQTVLYEGEFMEGQAKGTGHIYHPSGQLLYTGEVYDAMPRADAFLSLSLAEVEGAFTQHWQVYVWDGVTAFVYPYFRLMFVTESPVSFQSPTAQTAQTELERQELLDALSGQGAEDGAVARESDGTGDEILDPATDKTTLIITQVLSYGQPLPGVPQPEAAQPSGEHRTDWREWFSTYALGRKPTGVTVTWTGPLVCRFAAEGTPPSKQVEEYLAMDELLETLTVWNKDKDGSLLYQTAKWRE